jgi:dTMP kinase
MVWYVVDGMDGSGKTTASDFIKEQLTSQGRKVLEITHPNQGSHFGRISSKFLHIESKVSEIVATVFYILDVLGSLRIVKRSKNEYDDVIFVRYIMAVGYLPDRICGTAYRIIEKILPMPDVKIFVDLDAETSMKRIVERGEDLEIFESVEKLNCTRNKMLKLTNGWIIVDNSGTKDSTELQTCKIITSFLKENESVHKE